jgi:transcription initiation factor IIE alpha subunit
MSGAVTLTEACEQKGRYSRCGGSLSIIESLAANQDLHRYLTPN